jgi:hypothetical protein
VSDPSLRDASLREVSGQEISQIDPSALRIARGVARELAGAGARAVVMVGSYVRGDEHTFSDIDIFAILRKAPDDAWKARFPESRVRSGRLVSRGWETERGALGCLDDPRLLATFVPGWREAIILYDPEGVAARLQRRARAWSWDHVSDKCDAHVAKQVTGYAEEAHKLAGALEKADDVLAATQRALLAVTMAGIVSLHRRILFGTENILWKLVGEAMGAEWRRTQAAALSVHGESLRTSCRAALRLYALTAAEVWPVLDSRQRAVVRQAMSIRVGGRPRATARARSGTRRRR